MDLCEAICPLRCFVYMHIRTPKANEANDRFLVTIQYKDGDMIPRLSMKYDKDYIDISKEFE